MDRFLSDELQNTNLPSVSDPFRLFVDVVAGQKRLALTQTEGQQCVYVQCQCRAGVQGGVQGPKLLFGPSDVLKGSTLSRFSDHHN